LGQKIIIGVALYRSAPAYLSEGGVEQERNFLGAYAYQQARIWLQGNAVVAVDRQADIQSELWAEYQAVLVQL